MSIDVAFVNLSIDSASINVHPQGADAKKWSVNVENNLYIGVCSGGKPLKFM